MSPPPGWTPQRRRRSRPSWTELRRELGVTILYVSHEFGAIEPYVGRLVVVQRRIVFDGPPDALPQRWHDPSHRHGDLGHVSA